MIFNLLFVYPYLSYVTSFFIIKLFLLDLKMISHLKWCFFLNLKSWKKLTVVRVEPGSFGSVITCVTDGAIRVHTNAEHLIYKKKEIYALRTFGKILHWLLSNFSASLRVHNIFYFVMWMTLIHKSML